MIFAIVDDDIEWIRFWIVSRAHRINGGKIINNEYDNPKPKRGKSNIQHPAPNTQNSNNLRITNIERFVLNVPFREQCAFWNGLLVQQYRVVEIVRVTTNSSQIIGYGETLPHYTWQKVSDNSIEKATGKNPFELLGDDSLGAGLQMAIYDICGKAMEVPLYRLLNLPKVRDWCPIAWWNTKMPPELLAKEAQTAMENGYLAHKIKARPWFDIVEQVEAISAVTPEYYKIDIDWNDMLLNVGSASPVLQKLDQYPRVNLYEGVIPQRDVEGYRQLRKKTNRPILLHFGLPAFLTTIRKEMCDGYVVTGGISEVLREGILAAAFEKPFFLQLAGSGMTTAMMAHLGAVLPFAQHPAVSGMNNYADNLLKEPLKIQDGLVRVPENPGLGVEFNESVLEKYRMEPPYKIPYPRVILSLKRLGGRTTYYAGMTRGTNEELAPYSHLQFAAGDFRLEGSGIWEDYLAGNQPVYERGVRLEVWEDDGSKEWKELFERASKAPVHSLR